MVRRRARVRGVLAGALAIGLAAGAGSAGAVTTGRYASFEPLGGPAGALTTTVRMPGAGRPDAEMTSTSNTGSSVKVQAGTSTFLPASSPPGRVFGSSRDQQYLNLAPAPGGAPSVTTYVFSGPMPVGWGLVLGDVDADAVQVSATRADGTPASVADLGFAGTFNYAGGADLPTWDAATTTLTGSGSDTSGAAGWFEPTIPLRSVSLRFSVQTGFPTFQTWFGTLSRSVEGTVRDTSPPGPGCDVAATTVRLLDPAGNEVARTHPDADGAYSYPRVAAGAGFSVLLDDVPAGCAVVGAATRPVDLTRQDVVADFEVRHDPPPPGDVPVEVSGQTSTPEGTPVAGAEVVVREPDGTEVGRDTSDRDGAYAVDGDTDHADLTATVEPPAGYQPVGGATRPVVVPPGGGQVDVDFTLRPTGTGGTGGTGGGGTGGTGGTGVPGAADPGGAVLPDTGGPPRGLLAVGVLLVLAGTTCLRAGRQRSRRAAAA